VVLRLPRKSGCDAGESATNFMPEAAMKPRPKQAAASLVFAGILLSKIAGFVREAFFSRYLGGTSVAADAFRAAFRIPNFLQTQFGEGVLSASFIPVYAGLVARGDEEEAGRVAGAILAILSLVTSVIVVAGMLAAPLLVDVIAYGFDGPRKRLTVPLVRILFPGAGLLVMSAWCLGILNSHRRFFLSYSVSVLWNLAIIGTMLRYGLGTGEEQMAVYISWASVAGSAIQFLVQIPVVLRLVPSLRIGFWTHLESVRTVVRNFGPVFVSRGVVQISATIDSILASPVHGGPSMLGITAVLYTLPVSLFGMSVSASELPAMSSAVGTDAEIAAYLRKRLVSGLRRICFFVVPSAVAFVALGDRIIAAIFQGDRFTAADTMFGWGILAGSAVGLLAQTQGRLYSSTFYALKDTRTPLRYAVIRIVLTAGLGFVSARYAPGWLGIDVKWGIAGLTASAGMSGWIEFLLLRRGLSRRIGKVSAGAGYLARLWGAALVAAGVGFGIKMTFGVHRPIPEGIITLIPFAAVYLLLADPSQIRQYLRRRVRSS
jgi:putative peptidoglycan lipid II flippase